jgi:hypothetical protein
MFGRGIARRFSSSSFPHLPGEPDMVTPSRVALAFAGALTLGTAPCAAAQTAERTANNVIYAEVLGNAITLSVNYERFMTHNLAVRVGVNPFGAIGVEGESPILIVPVMFTIVSGRSSSHAELGLGARFANRDLGTGSRRMGLEGVYPTGTLGYRFQRAEGGWVARAGFTPILMADAVFPWIGFSIGYAF